MPPAKEHRALHPLDLFRKSLLSGQHHRPRGDRGRGGGAAARRDDRRHDDDEEEANGGIIRSAAELYEAGIRFRRPHHFTVQASSSSGQLPIRQLQACKVQRFLDVVIGLLG
uniref:Peptide/amino acid transporter-like protein n=1 Tax=Oryza sativa subsp. japonica TaxID=39947 RepID=Q8H465_ORYSJ|nr:peptide/amino acid transporter-like protein [Oryza sativa Japonica Group]